MMNHGVASYLIDLAEEIKNKLEISDSQYLVIKLREKSIIIDMTVGYIEGKDAFTEIIDKERNIFLIKISEPNVSLILHELKHIDRLIATNYNADIYYFITNIGIEVINRNKKLFYKNDREKLIDCFYYFSPDEFESQYNDIFYKLKETGIDNRENISDFLNRQDIYLFYKNYYEKGFNLNEFFKNENAVNIFIGILDKKIKEFKSGNLNYYNWRNIKPDTHIDLNRKKLEFKINKVISNGYKKFHRLYSLFLNN